MDILKTVGMIAGVGGLAIGMVILLFRDILAQRLFPKLTREQGAKQLRLIIIAVWSLGALGIVAWATVEIVTHPTQQSSSNEDGEDDGNHTEKTSKPDRTLVERSVKKQFIDDLADAMQKNTHKQSDYPSLIRKVMCDAFDETGYYNLHKSLTADLNDSRVKTFNIQCGRMANRLYDTMGKWGLDGSGKPISDDVFDKEIAESHISKASFELIPTAWSFFP